VKLVFLESLRFELVGSRVESRTTRFSIVWWSRSITCGRISLDL
jgi:hypothetical protein